MQVRPPDRIVQASSYLPQFDGCTLRWWSFAVSLAELCLRASSPNRALTEIVLGGTAFVDCPVSMHNVRLRVASDQETKALRLRLPPRLSGSLQREDHLVIDCDEGGGCIWAEALVVRCAGALSKHELCGPLWPGGPPLGEL